METNASARVVRLPVVSPSSLPTKAKSQSVIKEEASSLTPLRDRLELSDSSKALQNPDAQVHESGKKAAASRPTANHQSQWGQDRLARIDQLELLLHKGLYRVEPFMVDEIALRLARYMVNA